MRTKAGVGGGGIGINDDHDDEFSYAVLRFVEMRSRSRSWSRSRFNSMTMMINDYCSGIARQHFCTSSCCMSRLCASHAHSMVSHHRGFSDKRSACAVSKTEPIVNRSTTRPFPPERHSTTVTCRFSPTRTARMQLSVPGADQRPLRLRSQSRQR